MEVEGLPYREAVGENLARVRQRNRGATRAKQLRNVSAVSVSEPWSDKAEAVLSSAWQEMSKPGAVEFYRGRGISPETCQKLGLGWQSSDRFFPAEEWGLEAGKKLVVPAGCVLPVYRSGRVVSLLVRRSNSSQWQKWGKWCEVKGGARVPFILGPVGVPLVVVESILCAASIFQASGGTVAAVATLGATKGKGRGLDLATVEALKAASVVLVSGDRDEAGEALLSAVREVRPDAFPYRVPSKVGSSIVLDVNDLLQKAGERYVREWAQYGIEKAIAATGSPVGQARQERETETPASSSSAEQGEAPDHDNTDKVFSIETQDEAGEPEPFAGDDEADPKKGDERAMPERSETIDQEHGGTASDTMETPRDDGPDEFAAHVAYCREMFRDGPPMIAKDMPDWDVFCVGWRAHECFHCPYYDANPNGSPCTLWEAAFPCAVRWYPPTC